MSVRATLALSCLLLIATVSGEQYSTPITAWSTASDLVGGVSYQGLPAAAVLADLLGHGCTASPPSPSLASHLYAAEQPERQTADVVLLLVTPQRVPPPATAALIRQAAQAAASSVQLPNAFHEGSSSPALKALRRVPSGADVRTVGRCLGLLQPSAAAAPATPASVAERLAQRGDAGSVLLAVVCVDATSGDEQQAAVVAAALRAAQKLGGRLLAAHIAAPAAPPARRVLLSSPALRTGNYTYCDGVCQMQVKFLEGFIIFVVLALALGVGLCCMHGIDTPTRFASTREPGGRPHHD